MSDKVVWLKQSWQPVAVGFVPSEKAWHKEMWRMRCSEEWPEKPSAAGHTKWLENHTTGHAVILVTLHKSSERDAMEVISTIIHESVHVWQFICQMIGEKSPGIETEAYMIQNIAEQLIEAYTSTQGKGRDWLK